MERGKTIGVVVYQRDGASIRYLLLHHGGQYWNVPKGRPEPNETELQTALRELREETGITDVQVDPQFRFEHDYDFESHVVEGARESVHRHAIFFLGEAQSEVVRISSEHLDFGWLDYDTALKRMYYQQGRDLIKAAHTHLLAQQGFVL